MRRLVQLNAKKRPALVSFFRQEGRRRPEYTAWSYELGEIEHSLLVKALTKLGDANLKLVAPMFDGAIVRPAGPRGAVDLSVIVNHMSEDVEMIEKPFHRPPLSERVRKRLRTLR